MNEQGIYPISSASHNQPLKICFLKKKKSIGRNQNPFLFLNIETTFSAVYKRLIECASFSYQMKLEKTEPVSSQKGCYVKQHMSKFGLIQILDKNEIKLPSLCAHTCSATDAEKLLRVEHKVFSVNLGRAKIHIFCDRLLHRSIITQICPPPGC